MSNKNELFFIKKSYISREEYIHFDDTKTEGVHQLEVYKYAKEIMKSNNLSKIFDYGCGNSKKIFDIFCLKSTEIGLYDFEETIEFVKEKFKKNISESKNIYFKTVEGGVGKVFCDVLILADVIEHVVNPDEIINDILNNISFKYIIISTPDRDLISNSNPNGPPRNIHHVREWSFDEFKKFIKSRFDKFSVVDHFISNKNQSTQCICLKSEEVLK